MEKIVKNESGSRTKYIFPLAFLSGIGHGLTVITPSFWLNSVGASYTKIGLFSLASAAYGFSLFWIPLLDKINLQRILSKFGLDFKKSIQRKGFILITVMLAILCFFIASFCDPKANILNLAIPIALAAFSLATADSVMLAYTHETLQPKDMGANTAAYRLGIFLASASSLFVHENLAISWPDIYRYLAGVMLIMMCVIFISPKEKTYKQKTWQESFVLPYQDIISTYKFALINIVLFMALYKMHDRFVAPMEQLFLLKKLGPNIYFCLKAMSTFALSFSAIKSSNFLKRFGYKRTFITAIFASVITVASYFLCTFDTALYYAIAVILSGSIATVFYYMVGSKMWPIAGGIIGLSVYMAYSGLYAQAVALFVVVIVAKMTSGVRNSVLYSYQTSLCSKEYALTQVTLMTNIERLLLGTFLQGVSGFCVTKFNWSGFYMITIFMSLAPLVLVNFIRYKEKAGEN